MRRVIIAFNIPSVSRSEPRVRRKTYRGDAVGAATVDNGGSLRAVGGVVSDSLSDNTGEGTSGHGDSGSDGETHFDWYRRGIRGMFLEKNRSGKCQKSD